MSFLFHSEFDKHVFFKMGEMQPGTWGEFCVRELDCQMGAAFQNVATMICAEVS